MQQGDENVTRQYTSCRSELATPDNDWERSWRLARLRGLCPEMTTFLWRLLHRLLPTQDRVHRIVRKTTPSPHCQLCQDGVVEDLQHAFFSCSFNANTGEVLRRCLSTLMPRLTRSQILVLNFDLEPSEELPAVWLASHFLFNIWSSRVDKKKARLYAVRADLEARANLLRETRFQNDALRIGELIQNCFENL